MSLRPRGDRASGREPELAPLASSLGKDRELLNLAQWRSLSTLTGDVSLVLSTDLNWNHPSIFFFFLMSLFTVCSPSTHVSVSQEFSRNLMTPQMQKLRQFIWDYVRSFTDLRIQLCVLVHFDYFLSLLRGKSGGKIYTPNLSSNLLRDKQKVLLLGYSKGHTHSASIFWGRFQGLGLSVPENSAWGNPVQGGTGLGTWLLVLGRSLQSLYSPPPLGQHREIETELSLRIFLQNKTYVVM